MPTTPTSSGPSSRRLRTPELDDDRARRLRQAGRAPREAFDGTAQEGGDLPILYTEFGVQTEIPEEKRDVYTNLESPVANDAVPESTQQEYYRQAFELVCDQDNVEGLYIFHVWDEPTCSGGSLASTTPTAVPSRAGTHSSIYHPVRERSVRRVPVLPRRSGLATAPG